MKEGGGEELSTGEAGGREEPEGKSCGERMVKGREEQGKIESVKWEGSSRKIREGRKKEG
jgi:hypothetical protein